MGPQIALRESAFALIRDLLRTRSRALRFSLGKLTVMKICKSKNAVLCVCKDSCSATASAGGCQVRDLRSPQRQLPKSHLLAQGISTEFANNPAKILFRQD